MDLPIDLSKLLFHELFCYQQQQLDGLNCRVPTRTTPTITPVTPTTLRNFEQSVLGYQSEAESHQREAGFVPPLVHPMSSVICSNVNVPVTTTIPDSVGCGDSLYVSMADINSWQGGSTTVSEVSPLIGRSSPSIPTHVLQMSSGSSSSSPSSSTSSRSRKNTGGRRPNKDNGVSPEEEEKRKIRRERNKLAAARCRKKRMELITNLQKDVDELQGKKSNIQKQIRQLENERDELRTILESHQPTCHLRDTDSPEDIKPFMQADELNEHLSIDTEKSLNIVVSSNDSKFSSLNMSHSLESRIMEVSSTKQRPNYLPVSNSSFSNKNKNGINEIAGIPITTPSTEFFQTLMEGGTGLTPTTSSSFVSSCSTQLRSTGIMVDLSSPDSMPSKLVSL